MKSNASNLSLCRAEMRHRGGRCPPHARELYGRVIRTVNQPDRRADIDVSYAEAPASGLSFSTYLYRPVGWAIWHTASALVRDRNIGHDPVLIAPPDWSFRVRIGRFRGERRDADLVRRWLEESGFPFDTPPRRPNPRQRGVSGWFSLIFVIAVIAAGGTILYRTVFHKSNISGVVIDSYTLTPIAGATVVAGDLSVGTDRDGTFRLRDDVSAYTVTKQGYDAAQVSVTPGVDEFRVSIRPNTVHGKITSSADGSPVVGATVNAVVASRIVGTTTSNDRGEFELSDVPEGASLAVEASDFADDMTAINRRTTLEFQLRPDVLTGVVKDVQGNPIAGALVAVGERYTHTNTDGSYRLKDVGPSGTAYFKAPGFAEVDKPLTPQLHLDTSLPPITVKALYATALTASDPKLLNPLIDTIDTTELNAMVVDLKDSSGHVFYNSQVPLANDIKATDPLSIRPPW